MEAEPLSQCGDNEDLDPRIQVCSKFHDVYH